MGRRRDVLCSPWRDDRPTEGELDERVALFVGVHDTVLDDVSENILRAKTTTITCIYMYMYIYVYTHIHTHIYMYIRVCTCRYTSTTYGRPPQKGRIVATSSIVLGKCYPDIIKRDVRSAKLEPLGVREVD